MDELYGDQATWQFDGRTVWIRYRAGWLRDTMLAALGRCEVPAAAIASVDFNPREKRRRWALRLRLHDRADPYAAVGAMLTKASRPFRLTGPAKTALVAEYWADQLSFAAEHPAAGAPPPAELALGLVPPLPVHIKTAEGTATFDGDTVRLVWSRSAASSRKRRAQRREFPLRDIRAVEWAPSDGWQWGYLRVLLAGDAAEPPAKPAHDLSCLRCNEGDDESHALLLAATVTAYLWARDPAPPPALPGGGATDAPAAVAEAPAAGAGSAATDTESQVIYERIRQLRRLYEEGALTEEEFAAKKAELLDRL